jgi:hypothetical protein
VKVIPAIVAVPERAPPGLLAMLRVTEPPPVPLAREVTVIQGALLAAAHVHPLAAAMPMTALPPAELTVRFGGRNSKTHEAASCAIRTRASARPAGDMPMAAAHPLPKRTGTRTAAAIAMREPRVVVDMIMAPA